MRMIRTTMLALLLSPGLALAQATALVNGTAVDIPNTGAGTVRTYTLEVPANMTSLRVVMTGGAGDADLYVNAGEPYLGGTDPDVECESIDPTGPEEVCLIEPVVPGTWYIEINAVTDYGNGVQLVALAAVELADNVDETISGAINSVNWFYLDVPASQGHLTVTTRNGTGNPNMRIGPDLFGPLACSSSNSGTADSCEIDQPVAGLWFVRIAGVAAYAGVALNAEYGPERASRETGSGGALPPLTLGSLLLAALTRRRTRK